MWMVTIILIFLIVMGAVVLLRRGKTKRSTTMYYKPFEAIINGTSDHFSTDSINDSKHHVQYEEKTEVMDK